MKELVLDILKKSDKALTTIEISDLMNLRDTEQIKELINVLNELTEKFIIYKSNKERYMLFENSHLKKVD